MASEEGVGIFRASFADNHHVSVAALLRINKRPSKGNGRAAARPEAAIHGSARLGRRTKELVLRLDASDIAIIDHADLDRVAAEELVASGVRAVVNVAPS